MDGFLKFFSDAYHGQVGRRFVIFCIYAILLTISVWAAYQLRFDFFVSGLDRDMEFQPQIPYVILWVVPLKVAVLAIFKQHSGLLGYFGTPDLYRLIKAVLVGSAFVGSIRIQSPDFPVPPRGVILIDFILSLVMLAGFRTACRMFREALARPNQGEVRAEAHRIAIIGAGDVGASLAKELLNRRGLGRLPVAFYDDDSGKWNQRIHNIPVLGNMDKLAETGPKLKIDEVVIAMPNAPAKKIGEVVKQLQRLHMNFVTVPSLDQMATGKVRLSQFRPVEIQDLLRREPVEIDRENIMEMVNGRVILVTGAGGSIGSELCRQIAFLNPMRLLMVEQSEFLLFEIEQQLIGKGFSGIILPLVANILDEARMDEILGSYEPEVIFHAAALKHVPMMESQPAEAVKVNVLGTRLLARKAVEFGLKRFVMISTDKAINPTSVMGATKRFAEKYIQSMAAVEGQKTKFMAVRFGNVLGSSGSVIPTFKRQIAEGGPVKVTHPDVTRYFMTIPEAVGLVLQCGVQGKGGEIFVLDMGEPVKIVDLARALIELSGLRPDEDIEIEIVGLRPGEKLYEELHHDGEDFEETNHPKIMSFLCPAVGIEEIEAMVQKFIESVNIESRARIKRILKESVDDYSPFLQ